MKATIKAQQEQFLVIGHMKLQKWLSNKI